MKTALANLITACRVFAALELIGLAERLLPLHYAETFYALKTLADAIENDHAAELEDRRK